MPTSDQWNTELAQDVNGLLPSTKDSVLVAAAKVGDHSAFTELCKRSSPSLYRIVLRILKNHSDAEDAMQDSFFKAYRALEGFDQRAAFSSWLIRIGINSAFMILRKRRKYREEPAFWKSHEEGEWVGLDIADTTLGQDELFIQNELSFYLHSAIGRLPDSLRIVTELRQINGANDREISERLNLSLPAVKSRLLRARLAIKRMLKEEEITL